MGTERNPSIPADAVITAYGFAREDLMEHLVGGVHSDREANELTDTFEAGALRRAAVRLRTYADEMDAANEALRWDGAVHFRDAAGRLERTAGELTAPVLDEAQRMGAALAEVAEIASTRGPAENTWQDGYILAVKELRGIFKKYDLPLPAEH
jgi:hypothetical protein